MTDGYFCDREATAAVFDQAGWMDTGDLGYTLDGELVVTGRSKDLILWNGRNIWPQDIEWTVERLPGVRREGVAAFSIEAVDGDPTIVTIAECRLRNPTDRHDLERKVMAAIQSAVGVPSCVVLAPPHSLIRTSSGKLSRTKVKTQYLSGAFGGKGHPDAMVAADATGQPA